MSQAEADRCGFCGSTDIMPDVPLMDHFGKSGGLTRQAEVRIEGNSEAWFDKDAAVGKIFARICAGCGRTELWTTNGRELFAKYKLARARRLADLKSDEP